MKLSEVKKYIQDVTDSQPIVMQIRLNRNGKFSKKGSWFFLRLFCDKYGDSGTREWFTYLGQKVSDYTWNDNLVEKFGQRPLNKLVRKKLFKLYLKEIK